jgi:hypothetical protein
LVINDVKAKGLMYDYGYEYTYYAEGNQDSWFKNKRKNKKK